eukprot:9481130-Pyramimonas_sp.AAC.1
MLAYRRGASPEAPICAPESPKSQKKHFGKSRSRDAPKEGTVSPAQALKKPRVKVVQGSACSRSTFSTSKCRIASLSVC